MPNISNALKKSPSNAYYFLIALMPGMVMTIYYAGLTRKDVMIYYTDYSAIIKMSAAIITSLIVGLIILIVRRSSIIDALKNPQSLLIGILVGLCLPNHLAWWEVSSTVAFAIIVGRYLLSNRLHAVLVGYIFSLAAFPTSQGLSILIKNEVYNGHLLEINGAFALGGLFLAVTKLINWRTPLVFMILYSIAALLFKKIDADMPFSLLLVRSVFTPTTCLAAFFIAPFVFGDNPNTRTCLMGGAIMAVLVFLLHAFAHYPDALLLTLILINVSHWAIDAKHTSLNNNHVVKISSHPLLTPILSASIVMIIASNTSRAAIAGAIVVLTYISVQSISDVIKRYIPQSNVLSLVIVLTAFLSAYIGLSLKVYWPEISQTINDAIPLLALSSLILSCSGIFTGNAAPFSMINALKTSALFLVFVLLVGSVSQFTDFNRTLSAGLFFLFSLIALYNNPKLSNIEIPENKPNRRVRTTGTIK